MPTLFGPLVPPPPVNRPPSVVLVDHGANLVAYGHVDARLFVCLALATTAHHFGLDLVLGELLDPTATLDEWVGEVEHLWAVEHHDPDRGQSVQWVGLTADTPGAFPITVLFTG